MPDDKTKRHPLDGKRIDIHDQKEIYNWCKSLNISSEELIAAVKMVGSTSSEKIRKYLGK